jgi:DHA3 family macrolide efflux protein-like MFS transporter
MKNLSAILLLFLANSISGVAQGISMIAIPWYFAQQQDMTRFGFIYGLATVISFLWVPYSGTLVDKYNRKHIFLALTFVSGIIVLSTGLVGQNAGALPWWVVGGIFMLTFFNYNLHYPNLYAFAQEISEKKQYGRITSLLEIVGQSTNVIAGAGAAMLLEGTQNGMLNLFGIFVPSPIEIAPWEIYHIFLFDGCTYFVALVILSLIRYTPLVRRTYEAGNIRKRMRTGLNWLQKNPAVFVFGVASYCLFATVLIEVFFLGANYVQLHLGEGGDVFGASEMFYGVGAIAAGFAIRWIFRRTTTPTSILIMTFITAILYFVLFGTRDVWIFYFMSFLLGITNAGVRIQRTTFLFKLVPNQVYGRASSIFFLFNAAFRIILVGAFSLPFFQQTDKIAWAFAIMGIFLILAGLVLVKNRSQLQHFSES